MTSSIEAGPRRPLMPLVLGVLSIIFAVGLALPFFAESTLDRMISKTADAAWLSQLSRLPKDPRLSSVDFEELKEVATRLPPLQTRFSQLRQELDSTLSAL